MPINKVLIVDDRETNRKVLRATLQAESLETLEASDGVQALDCLAQHSVDCVITDILMPNLDGYRLCQKIRTDNRFKNIPIIIYTATYLSPSDEKLALDSGADRYLKKPAAAKDMMEAIHSLSVSTARRAAVAPEAVIIKEYSELLIKKLEEKNLEVQASEEKFRQLVENMQPVFYMVDIANGALLYVSPSYESQWGRSCASLYAAPASWMDPIIPEDRAGVEGIMQKIPDGSPFEYRIERSDGIRWIRARSFPISDPSGKVIRFSGIAEDITERKMTELELRRRLEEIETFNLSAVGRELRMIELKKQVNELSQALKKAPPYDLTGLDPEITHGK